MPKAADLTISMPEHPLGLDLRFYTEGYKLTLEEKKMLVEFIMHPSFRVFEKYLDWRINAAAHRMVLAEDDQKAGEVRSEIRSLAKIPADMKNFWDEVKKNDMMAMVELEKGNTLKPKIFGRDKSPLTPDNEDNILQEL